MKIKSRLNKECIHGHLLVKSNIYIYSNGTAHCKECKLISVKKYKEKHKESYMEKARKYQIKHSKEHKRNGKNLIYVAKWVKKNPEKQKAHKIIARVIKAGRIKKQPCQVCGNIKVDGHHPDYSKPLEVMWLCHSHHMELHRKG